jgi:hypothetical protein
MFAFCDVNFVGSIQIYIYDINITYGSTPFFVFFFFFFNIFECINGSACQAGTGARGWPVGPWPPYHLEIEK